MEINSKKSLKILALVITSLLISFASAATYSELFMNATPITIGSAGVYFAAGTNTTAMGGTINTAKTVVTFSGITIEPGQVKTYAQSVNITNTAGSIKTLNMSLDSLTGNFSTNFDYVYIYIVSNSNATQGTTIQLVSSGTNVTSTGNVQIANGITYTVRWVISAKETATTGQSINIALRVKVS